MKRIRMLSLGVFLLAGCSGSTTPAAEGPAIPQADQAASTQSIRPAEVRAEVRKPAASSVVSAARARDNPPKEAPPVVAATPLPVDQPKEPDTIAPPPADAPPTLRLPEPPLPPPAPERTTRQVTIPEGTLISVRTTDSIDSATGSVGQTFHAALDAPLTVDRDTLAPRGADVYLRMTHVESAGSVKGQSKVSLELDRISVAGKLYTVASNVYEKEAAPRGEQTVKRTGIGAGIGAVIGAIAGGKKGAAIGAGVGGGAGVAVDAAGKGEQVHIDSESRIDFRLLQPLEVTIEAKSSATNTQMDSSSGPRMLTSRGAATDDSAKQDFSGRWRLSLDSPQGSRNAKMTLTQTGDRLEGTFDSRGRTQSLRGTVHGNSVTFSTSSTSADSSEQIPGMRFEGRISNDRLSGTMTIAQSRGFRGSGQGGRGGNHGGRDATQSFNWTADRDD